MPTASKRRSPRAAAPTDAVPTSTPEPAAPRRSPRRRSTTAEVPATPVAADLPTTPPVAPAAPRRRRRSEATEALPPAAAPVEAEPPAVAPAAPVSEPPPAATRRRRSTAAPSSPAPQPVVETTTTVVPEAVLRAVPRATPEAGPTPPKRSRRRSTAPAPQAEVAAAVEPATDTPAAAAEPAATAEAPTPETPAAETAPAAPRRRAPRRRSSEAPAEPAAATATPEPLAAPAPSPAPSPAPAEAPAPTARSRRRSALPPADANTDTDVPAAPAAEVAEAAAAAPAPQPVSAADAAPAAPRRRSRRSPAAAAPAEPPLAAEAPTEEAAAAPIVDAVVDADNEATVAAPAPEADQKTARTTGRRRRRQDTQAATAVTTEAGPTESVEAAPLTREAPATAPTQAVSPAAEAALEATPEVAADDAAASDVMDGSAQEDSRTRRPRRRRGRGRGEAVTADATPEATTDTAQSTAPETPLDSAPAATPEAAADAAAPEAAEPVVAPAPAPEPAPRFDLADTARFACPEPGDDPFGWHEVRDRRSGAVHRLRLRDLAAGDSHCDCEDFAADPQGRCPHLHSLLAHWLAVRPELLATLRRGEQRAHSELHLRHAAQQRIVWRLGSEAAPALREAVTAACDADGSLHLEDGEALQPLQRLAARQGHRVEVEEGVWTLLGEQHDTRRRLLALEAAYPAGPADAGLLQGLLRHPVAPHQLEAALLATCAGRCVLADEAGLGKVVQALATLALQRRHFGAERMLVAAPAGWLRRWQRAIARWTSFVLRPGLEGLAADDAPLLRLISLDELRSQVDTLAAWAPDVLVIDEGLLDEPPWLGDTGAALRRLDPGATLLLARRPLQTRPQALPALLRWLDPLRLGPTRRLLEAHAPQVTTPAAADPTGAAAGTGWRDLDRLGETLLPLLLQRRRHDAAGPAVTLPGDDDVQTLPLDAAQRARHQAQRERAERLVARWERVGDLSSREQRELFTAVQGMRQACVVPAEEGAAEAKTAALLSLMQELSPRAPEVRLVVFSQWPAALQGLARALARQGLGHQVFDAGMDDAALAEGAARFARDPQPLVALVDDAVRPRLRLVHDLAGVVHLDRPWHPQRLAERLGCVQAPPAADVAADAAAQPAADTVPVLHLIAEGSIEEALLDLQSTAAAQGDRPGMAALAERLDGPAGGAFLGGTALATAVQQLREVLRVV